MQISEKFKNLKDNDGIQPNELHAYLSGVYNQDNYNILNEKYRNAPIGVDNDGEIWKLNQKESHLIETYGKENFL